MEELVESLKNNGLSTDHCRELMKELLDQQYDSEMIID